MTAIKRALISVSDKKGIVKFANALNDAGIEIISTGGTFSELKNANIDVKDVSSVTSFPEILDGRVKTLHPKIHGGLLNIRSNKDHQKTISEQEIENIDLLVVNLYPFEDTIKNKSDYETCIENIDIGGPAMIRAAAKNHQSVGVIVDPDDYDEIINEMSDNDLSLTKETLKKLALKAFARTAAYDSIISNWLSNELDIPLGKYKSIGGIEHQNLRYGENPHQKAKFYNDGSNVCGLITANQIQGKELSYNNINDTNAAFELVSEFDPSLKSAVAIIKHANPCGVATGDNLNSAYKKALRCDSVSAFGGIIASALVSSWSLVIASALGSFLVLLAVLAITFKIKDTMAILIIGLMFGSVTAAVVAVLSYFTNAEKLQQFIFWSFGSLGNQSGFGEGSSEWLNLPSCQCARAGGGARPAYLRASHEVTPALPCLVLPCHPQSIRNEICHRANPARPLFPDPAAYSWRRTRQSAHSLEERLAPPAAAAQAAAHGPVVSLCRSN